MCVCVPSCLLLQLTKSLSSMQPRGSGEMRPFLLIDVRAVTPFFFWFCFPTIFTFHIYFSVDA